MRFVALAGLLLSLSAVSGMAFAEEEADSKAPKPYAFPSFLRFNSVVTRSKFSPPGTLATSGMALTATGTGATAWAFILGTNISSGPSSHGLVLQADGNGGSVWETVNTASLGGTISNAQLANSSLTVTTGTGLTGGGSVSLGGAVSIGSTATSANTPNAIVARDNNGDFSAGTLSAAKGFSLPATSSASVGVINQNGNNLLHTFGTDNLFVGVSAGNFLMTGTGNSAMGNFALFANTTGVANTASGFGALRNSTTGVDNTASGSGALDENTTGSRNTSYGAFSLAGNLMLLL